MLYFLQQFLNGAHSGAIYALLAFGYSLANGVLHRTNLAHGALFGFAGQVMILSAIFGYQMLWLTLPASIAFGGILSLFFAGLVAWVLSKSVVEKIADRSPNAVIAITLGVSLVLMELGRIAADTKDYWLPPLLQVPVVFAARPGFQVTLTALQLVDCAVAVAILALAGWTVAQTRYGRAWRAVSDDPLAAALCGVDPRRVFRSAMVASGLLAGIAGIIAALYYGNISFGTGLIFGLKVLFVTALGGYSAPSRAALGGFAFGIAESLWSGYFAIEWRDAWIFGLLVAMLILRPERVPETKLGGAR